MGFEVDDKEMRIYIIYNAILKSNVLPIQHHHM